MSDRITAQDRRRRLQVRIDGFEKNSSKYLDSNVDMDDGQQVDLGSRWDNIVDEDGPLPGNGDDMDEDEEQLPPEKAILSLPSNIGLDRCLDLGLDEVVKSEILLREGQANDALHNIRYALGYKSFLYRTAVRTANSQRTKLRSFDEVNSVQKVVQRNARIYSRARQAIIALTTEDDDDRSPDELDRLRRYRELRHEDLKAYTAINEPVIRGMRNETLAWIWNVDMQGDVENSPWMKECMPGFIAHCRAHPLILL